MSIGGVEMNVCDDDMGTTPQRHAQSMVNTASATKNRDEKPIRSCQSSGFVSDSSLPPLNDSSDLLSQFNWELVSVFKLQVGLTGLCMGVVPL